MEPSLIILIVIAVIVALLLGWFVVTMNKMRETQVTISEARSDIDTSLVKRYDTITKLLSIVKEYEKHEKELMIRTTELRTGMTMQEVQEANKAMDEASEYIRWAGENYPDMRSSENFLQLQDAVSNTEEHIQASRRLYNSNVSHLNKQIVVFPSNLVAKICCIKKEEFFKGEEEKLVDMEIKF